MRSVFLLALLAWPSSALAQATLTARTWEGHPSIRVIRQLVSAIDHDSARFAATKDSAICSGDASDLEAHLWIDSTGRPHKYRLSGGSGDSAGEARYYYDTTGQLRFIFTSLRAANGTELENRVYYAPDGRLLHRDSRLVTGPGWSGGFDPTPIYTPAEHMAHLCDAR